MPKSRPSGVSHFGQAWPRFETIENANAPTKAGPRRFVYSRDPLGHTRRLSLLAVSLSGHRARDLIPRTHGHGPTTLTRRRPVQENLKPPELAGDAHLIRLPPRSPRPQRSTSNRRSIVLREPTPARPFRSSAPANSPRLLPHALYMSNGVRCC